MMEFLKLFRQKLPTDINWDRLRQCTSEAMWTTMPELAASIALSSSGLFNSADYLNRYPDVVTAEVDPICHYIKYGIYEGRFFKTVTHTCNLSFSDIQYISTSSLSSPPLISVLVPVYNNPQYLEECLGSIVSQSLNDLEIIIINDGSTEADTIKIIDDIMAVDKRIRLINKSNSGYGHSMNEGLKYARGKYIGIVESDDFIAPEMFENLYIYAEKNNAEIAKSAYFAHSNEGDRKMGLPQNWEIFQECVVPSRYIELFNLTPSIWSAIYNRAFLVKNDIFFNETPGASFQDTSFFIKCVCACQKFIFLNKEFYYYRIDNTASSVKSNSKIFCICDEFENIHNYLADHQNIKIHEINDLTTYSMFSKYWWNYFRLDEYGRSQFYKIFVDSLDKVLDNKYLTEQDLYSIDNYIHNNIQEHQKLVTIIVPCYNVESYIARCLDSLICQPLKHIEIICVDDCSTDNTCYTLANYERENINLKVVKLHENGGLGRARNTGLEYCSGRFIVFLDSDDWLAENAIAELYLHAAQTGADMVMFSGFNVDGNNNLVNNEYWQFDYLPDDLEMPFSVDRCSSFLWQLPVSACLTMYRREFIEKKMLRFPEGKIFEDNLFFIRSVLSGALISILDRKLYNRQLHDSQITKRSDISLMDSVDIYEACYKEVLKSKLPDEVKYNYFSTRFNHLQHLLRQISADEHKQFFEKIKRFFHKFYKDGTFSKLQNQKFCKQLLKHHTQDN